tara:strand:+ start:129 stop:2168 length:2040 start_codon:yes stop_codon:yes gene_type:complete
MASVNLTGTLTNPEGEPDEGAIVKFTLLTTTGNTVSSSKSQLEVPQDGLYNIDIVYGNLRVDYINEDGTTRFVAIVTVNGDTVATSLPELLSAAVPPTNAQLLEFQGILADAVTAQAAAEAAETGAVAAKDTAIAVSIIQYRTFAELVAISETVDYKQFTVAERANAAYTLQPSGYTALAGDATLANGRVAALQLNGGGNAYVEWFDSPQNGVDRLKDNGGGTLHALGRYTLTETLVLDGGSVTIKGAFTKSVFSSTVSINDNGVFYADFTDGPAILISDGGAALEGLIIQGSAARRNAVITTGAQNANSGIVVETSDGTNDILQSVKIDSVRCVSHPADGLLVDGDVTNIRIVNFYSNDVGRHGIGISAGGIGGRSIPSLGGIMYIEKGKSFDCGGHGLCIGHPNDTQFPYRITVINREGYRLALDPLQRHSIAGNFVVAQNVEMINCAFGGTTTGNVADHAGLEIGGRDIKITGCRYISSEGNYLLVRQQAGFSTKNLTIDGGIANTTGTPPDYFASIAAGCDGVTIKRVDHDCINPVTDIPYSSTNDDITLHDLDENLTVHANHVDDFSDSNMIRNNNGGSLSITSANVTVEYEGFYTVDTEGDTASDDLVSILGGNTGDQIIIRQQNSGRTVTVKDGTGNIRLAGSADYLFPSTSSYLKLMRDGSNWQEISRSEN